MRRLARLFRKQARVHPAGCMSIEHWCIRAASLLFGTYTPVYTLGT
jgi:hypothetical protein